jgi:TolA-binding protein
MRMKRFWMASLAAMALSAPVIAQTPSPVDLRVGKLEKEMKAVQRVVFPGGAPLQPEIVGATGPATATGSPATSAVSDLTARIDALEKGLASLTGQVEQNGNRARLAGEAMQRLEARVAALEGTGATAAAPAVGGPAAAPVRPTVVAVKPTTVDRPAAPAPAKPATAKVDPNRKAAVAAIEMPATGDAAEDAYSYGYRLYAAKFYPEAVVKLKEFVTKYPSHKRASYAQNLLGRAYFDDGKPALASVAFYDNYQKMPKGERAAESLYWLGQALTKLKKLPDACKVYDELNEVYGARLSADLKAKATRGRADARCTG